MPRTFNTAIQSEIDKRFAGEPMVIVEVSWVDGSWIAYSDRKLNGDGYPYPLLISIAQFDSTQVISNGADNQQTSITLNDIDGTLRTLIDEHDIHLRPVRIYLTFQGLPFAEKALVFEGVINSDIVWDEGGRTLSFEVLSTIESVEAGFTMEDGDFPFIEPADRNKPWPLVFGQVCNMEAVQVRGTRKGFLAEGVGVKDPTIEERLCQAKKLQCPTITATVNEEGEVGNNGATLGIGGVGNLEEKEVHNNPRQGKVDPQCVKRRFDKICEILTEKAQQEEFVKTVFTVRGGQEFPQNEKITIQINEVRFEGEMSGETFTVSQTIYPNRPDNPPCVDVPAAGWGYRYGPGADETPTNVAGCTTGGTSLERDVQNGSGETWDYFNVFERADFIWLPPGTEVLLADEAEVLNIVSLLPGTVDQVAAYRNFADTSLLMAVDTDRYTVVTTDFGGYEVVEVRLDAPLSTIDEEDWDDEIFVSFTSSIGPNPADVVEWLVETYTDLTVDAASFAAVNASLTNYPSNFFVKARPRVFDLIRDVAYQARCAVFIRDNVVYMVYLSKEPTSVKTLTETDILPNSFRIGHTRTEDLETRTTVSWSEGEAGVFKTDPTEFEFVLKHNIPKYGVFDAEYDYYTLNIFELVEKSATFWSIRKSNTWKIVEFETPLIHLNLDVFDCITIDLSQFGPIKVVITSAKFNLDTNTLSFQAWTPIRSGESTEYIWAWPALQDQNAVHPLAGETDVSGDKYPLQVIPPIGHPLRGSYDPDSAVLNTDGDKHPSDLDDVFPTLVCKIATGAELQGQLEPDFDPFEPLAEKNFIDKLDTIESGGLTFSLEDAESPEVCGEPTPSDACNYEVTVNYVTPSAITTRDINGTPVSPGCYGPCGCGGTLGRPCFGPQHSFCHSFGAAFAATAFASQKKQEASALWDECRYQCGVTNVLNVGAIKGIEGNGAFGGCESFPGSEDSPGANEGQTQKPGLSAGDASNAPAASSL